MKIISFAVYGNNPKYLNGIIENLKLQPKIYPGWICRIYATNDVGQEFLNSLKEYDCQIVMRERERGHLSMFNRFIPFKDPDIERFIVRDADSRLNPREADAVSEWEESGMAFHIMRDHPQHAAYICGGMWGATKEFSGKFHYEKYLSEYLRALPPSAMLHERGPYFNTDQPFLWRYVWPRVINTHIAHIKDLDRLRFTTREKLFRVENPDKSFVGQPYEL